MQSIFGTDGIRGIFDKELTYSLAYKVGYALGVSTKPNNPILLGRDTRVSGYILLEAISRGINAAGKEFIYLGICPTPAIPFLIKKEKFSSGLMISASHNPPSHNCSWNNIVTAIITNRKVVDHEMVHLDFLAGVKVMLIQ